MSPISLPSEAVIIPIRAIVNNIPVEKIREILNVRPVDIFPWEDIYPTIRGMLERWHGDSSTERTPQIKEADIASHAAPDIASYKYVKRESII